MAENFPEKSGPGEPAHGGHEPTDASISGVVKFGVGLAILIVIALVAVSLTERTWNKLIRKEQPAVPPLTAKERSRLPRDIAKIPEPRLQKDEIQDTAAFRNREEAMLGRYGWVDRKSGIVRIPIEHAMDLLADRDKARRFGIEIQAGYEAIRVKPREKPMP
jgi:hypothetical protein